MDDTEDTKALRQKLLTEVYALAFSGSAATLLDEKNIRLADTDELLEIARRYGLARGMGQQSEK